MKKNVIKPVQSILKELKHIALLFSILAFSSSLFAQGNVKKDLVVKGQWEYNKKDFTGVVIKDKRRYAKYDSVTIAISNNIDSLKLIRSIHSMNRKKEGYWEFESGTMISFNKFGESKNQSFTKLIIPDLRLKLN